MLPACGRRQEQAAAGKIGKKRIWFADARFACLLRIPLRRGEGLCSRAGADASLIRRGKCMLCASHSVDLVLEYIFYISNVSVI